MIIFEGTDCAGKTTLANAVLRDMSGDGVLRRFVRYGLLSPDWDYFRDYFRDIGRGVIADRFTLSEAVYGPILRSGINHRFTACKQAAISRELQRQGALTVFVDPPWHAIERRLKDRGDKLVNQDQIKAAHKKFRELVYDAPSYAFGFKKCGWDNTHFIRVNSTGSSEVYRVREAYSYCQESTRWYEKLNLDGYGPMDSSCQAVFIGEQGSPNLEYTYGRYVPRAFAQGPVASYLYDMIVIAGLNPNRVHMVNAIQGDDRELPGEAIAWATQYKIPIIALGGVATRVCEKLNVRCILGDHPNYTLRFFHGAKEKMALWLKKEIAAWPRED